MKERGRKGGGKDQRREREGGIKEVSEGGR